MTVQNKNTRSVDSVDDPRIDSPDIKVIYSDMAKGKDTPVKPDHKAILKNGDTELDIDYEELGEVTITPKAKKTEEEPHECELGFGEAFKQNWIAFVSIILAALTLGFFIGRLTKKGGSK